MLLSLLALWGCGSGRVIDGRVVDGLTGAPVAGQHVLLQATEAAGMACMQIDAVTDAEGRFHVDTACGVPYHLKPSGEDLWFAAGDEIAADAHDPLALELWRAPDSPGVYRLANGEFEPLRTGAELKTRQLAGSDAKVSFPSKVPDKLPLVGAGEHLVLVGKENADAIVPLPLLPAPELQLVEPAGPVTQAPWVYLGQRITPGAPPTIETVAAGFDAAKVKAVEKGDRAVKFVPSDALPPGRYGLASPGDKRVYLVDFGVAGSPPAGSAPPADRGAAPEPGEAPPGTPPAGGAGSPPPG